MICRPCRETDHDDCPGEGWCDCQHRGDAQADLRAAMAEAQRRGHELGLLKPDRRPDGG